MASAHPLATEAGIEVLRAGGNAFDAAVAVSAALAVVEPDGSGLGGGGFYLLHDAEEERTIMLDARERAPGRASRDMYLDDDGELAGQRSLNGPLAAGIPGEPAALAHLGERYGDLSLSRALAPAIRLAREGFPVPEPLHESLEWRRDVVADSPAAKAVFLPQGEPVETGDTLRQGDLARTLERLADEGAAGFYEGPVARRLVEGVREAGGIWTREDLRDYSVVEREPITARYRGMTVTAASPPSSGGVTIAEALNILAPYDLADMGRADRVHLLAEAMRRAYRDRNAHLGDPDHVDMPLERLLSPRYAAGLRSTIRMDRALPSEHLKPVPAARGGRSTTHFSVLDGEGNRVAATLSINYPFGSGFMAPGTGVMLNNEMNDFAVEPGEPNAYGLVQGEANAIAPGKRMLSSMTPAFLEADGRTAVLGTPGGSRIISMVLLAALEFVEGGDAEALVKAPRFHHQYLPDAIQHEPGALDEDVRRSLRERGHALEDVGRRYGDMHVIVRDRRSADVEAASDPRGIGRARVLKGGDRE